MTSHRIAAATVECDEARKDSIDGCCLSASGNPFQSIIIIRKKNGITLVKSMLEEMLTLNAYNIVYFVGRRRLSMWITAVGCGMLWTALADCFPRSDT